MAKCLLPATIAMKAAVDCLTIHLFFLRANLLTVAYRERLSVFCSIMKMSKRVPMVMVPSEAGRLAK